MRLKQLLGIILGALVATAPTLASVSQLAGVRVENRDNAGIVTIRAKGAFTHTEYRPTDTLMLVDLAGVSIGRQDTNLHQVAVTGVQSYRVLGYKSATGAEVARIELNLAHGAGVKVQEIDGGLELRIASSAASGDAAPAVPAVKPVAMPVSQTATLPVPARTSRISKLTVARGHGAIDIEVSGSGPMVARTMKLSNPQRIVFDIPNSILEGRAREIPVNAGDIKDVRAARYQSNPPATRIVVDVTAMHDFEVLSSANSLVLKLKTSTGLEKPSPQVVAQGAAQPENPVSSKPETVTSVATASNQAAPVQETPSPAPAPVKPAVTETAKAPDRPVLSGQARAEQAASHLVRPDAPPPSSNSPIPGSASLSVRPAAVNAAIQQQTQQPAPAAGQGQITGCTSGRYTGEPINVNLKDLDLKDFFRLIHDISGLNIVLDPNVKGSLTIVLDDVPWDQALAIVLNNNGLDCQLQGNVLRIATLETLKAEAEAKRAQLAAQELAVPKQTFTRYLSYAHAKDVVPIVKKFLTSRGDVVADDRSNAIIVDDIPATQTKVDALLVALDRKTPEVEIEARVVSATRSFVREIGTQLAFGWGDNTTATGGGLTTPGPITLVPGPGSVFPFIQSPTAGQIPLFSNLPATGPTSGIAISQHTFDYRLDFVLTMAENRGLVKVLSRPRIVTQNNIKALVRQGARIPIVTLAQLGGPPTVQFVDAFLRLSVTPQITADNTIFLDVDVENTTPDFTKVTGAQLNPSLNTSQSTTQVLVSDGQTVVIGGVMQTQNNLSVAQVPLLGNIPFLGNLFKHTSINTSTQELIFFITPKIIQT